MKPVVEKVLTTWGSIHSSSNPREQTSSTFHNDEVLWSLDLTAGNTRVRAHTHTPPPIPTVPSILKVIFNYSRHIAESKLIYTNVLAGLDPGHLFKDHGQLLVADHLPDFEAQPMHHSQLSAAPYLGSAGQYRCQWSWASAPQALNTCAVCAL